MRRSLPLAVATLALVVSACGGDDDTAAATTTTATSETGPSTTIGLPVASDECEDVPDPADYVEGEIPPALRPCTPPTDLVVQTIRPGTGHAAQLGDRLIVDFTGVRVEDGSIFDSSYLRGVPTDVELGAADGLAGLESRAGRRPGRWAGETRRPERPGVRRDTSG